jgi:hypothetical protein
MSTRRAACGGAEERKKYDSDTAATFAHTDNLLLRGEAPIP